MVDQSANATAAAAPVPPQKLKSFDLGNVIELENQITDGTSTDGTSELVWGWIAGHVLKHLIIHYILTLDDGGKIHCEHDPDTPDVDITCTPS